GARAVKTAVKTGLEAAAQISATSVTMLKVTPPAPTAVLKTNTSAATMPTAPVGAATPPAPKPADGGTGGPIDADLVLYRGMRTDADGGPQLGTSKNELGANVGP